MYRKHGPIRPVRGSTGSLCAEPPASKPVDYIMNGGVPGHRGYRMNMGLLSKALKDWGGAVSH